MAAHSRRPRVKWENAPRQPHGLGERLVGNGFEELLPVTPARFPPIDLNTTLQARRS